MGYYKTDKGILREELDEYGDVSSPREFNDFSIFLTFERGYSSPDKSEYKSYKELIVDLVGEKADKIYSEEGVGKGNDYVLSYLTKRGYAALPVYKYEHSGIAYKAAKRNPFFDDWDSGLVGMIYVTPEVIKRHYNVNIITKSLIEQIQKRLKEEVEYYSNWANGDVYIYYLYPNENEEPEIIGGFIGDMSINGVKDYFDIKECEYIGQYYIKKE